MRCVALMRNINQGQRGHPSTDDILAGFADAGCRDAVTFQSNGTVLVEADDPDELVDAASAAIAARSGHERDIFWISLDDLTAVAEKHRGVRDPRRFEFTLHGGGTIDIDDRDVVVEAHRQRCEIIDSGPAWALVRNKVEGEGHATPVLERLTGGLATSRGLPTILRLVDRFGS